MKILITFKRNLYAAALHKMALQKFPIADMAISKRSFKSLAISRYRKW